MPAKDGKYDLSHHPIILSIEALFRVQLKSKRLISRTTPQLDNKKIILANFADLNYNGVARDIYQLSKIGTLSTQDTEDKHIRFFVL